MKKRWLVTLILLTVLFLSTSCKTDDDDDNNFNNDTIVIGDDDQSDDDSTNGGTDDDAVDDDLSDDDIVDDDVVDDDAVDDDAVDDDAVDDDAVDDDQIDDDTVGDWCYIDRDFDGYGSAEQSIQQSGSCPYGWSDSADDCNDADFLAHPGAPELPNDGVDQNCDEADLLASDENGVFVSPAGQDENPGTMAQPKLTVQAGIDEAVGKGKYVFVAAGEYQESVSASVSIFGGYDPDNWTTRYPQYDQPSKIAATGEEALRVPIGADVIVERFILDGTAGQIGAINLGTALFASCSAVGGAAGETFGILNAGYATIVDCEAAGGEVTGDWDVSIGVSNSGELLMTGTHAYGLDVNYTNLNTVIWDSKVEVAESGYICNQNAVTIWGTSSVLIYNSWLEGVADNFAYPSSNLVLVNNVIDGRVAGEENSVVMINNIVREVWSFDGSVFAINNVFWMPEGEECSVQTLGNNYITLYNNVFWNEAGAPDALVCIGSAEISEIAEVNACEWSGCLEAADNMRVAPEFVDAANGDFHLTAESPCIDAGYTTSFYHNLPVMLDFEGDIRPFGDTWDIGVDEYRPAAHKTSR